MLLKIKKSLGLICNKNCSNAQKQQTRCTRKKTLLCYIIYLHSTRKNHMSDFPCAFWKELHNKFLNRIAY